MSTYVSHPGSVVRYVDAPNLSISAAGTTFAYRDIGPRTGVPLILLNHWGAVLDNFDPPIVDGLATRHRVIAIAASALQAGKRLLALAKWRKIRLL